MRKKLNIDDGTGVHMGDEIRSELNKQCRSIAWLANQIDHDTSNLTKQLSSQYIHPKWLYEISKVLKKGLKKSLRCYDFFFYICEP